MRTRRLLAVALTLTAIAAIGVAGPADAAVTHSHSAAHAAKDVSAKTLLAKLRVHAPDYSRPYKRSKFDYPLTLHGRCDTRKEVLIRDHIGSIRISASCAVYGKWKSLYDNRVTTDPYSLEIDHLVPLAEAWHAGADTWSHTRLAAFGNDIAYKWDLQAVTTSLNEEKGADDPSEWLPPKHRCTYVKAWIGVKYRWNLTVSPTEKSALSADLTHYCGSDLQVLRPGKPDLKKLT